MEEMLIYIMFAVKVKYSIVQYSAVQCDTSFGSRSGSHRSDDRIRWESYGTGRKG